MKRRPPRSTRTDTTLSLHDALPIYRRQTDLHPGDVGPGPPHDLLRHEARAPDFQHARVHLQRIVEAGGRDIVDAAAPRNERQAGARSEEHTSELQSLMRISYAVFCLKKKHRRTHTTTTTHIT